MTFLLKATRTIKRLSKGAMLLSALSISIASHAATPHPDAFVHPGLLQTEQDFLRIREKLANHNQPWLAGWQKLIANRPASLAWNPSPVAVVSRGADGQHPENYARLFNDAAAAYALALGWQLSGGPAYADKAVAMLHQWSSPLTSIEGTSDRFLASGLYGVSTGPRRRVTARLFKVEGGGLSSVPKHDAHGLLPDES